MEASLDTDVSVRTWAFFFLNAREYSPLGSSSPQKAPRERLGWVVAFWTGEGCRNGLCRVGLGFKPATSIGKKKNHFILKMDEH